MEVRPSGFAAGCTAPGECLVRVDCVSKVYPSGQLALSEISLDISTGDRLALIGPNGSGKSTLLRLMAGLSTPTKGSVVRRTSLVVGYVPEHDPPISRFSPRDYLGHMAAISGMSKEMRISTISSRLAYYNLLDVADTPLSSLSKGMRRKVGILQALIPLPSLLLLDEPTSGLDSRARADTAEFLDVMAEQGLTLAFSTHDAGLVESLATRCLSLQGGRIEYTRESRQEVKLSNCSRGRAREGRARICIALSSDALLGTLAARDGVISFDETGHIASYIIDGSMCDSFLLEALRLGCSVISVDNRREPEIGSSV